MPCTTTSYKHLRIIVYFSGFLYSNHVAKSYSICHSSMNFVFLSALSHVDGVGPLPLDPATSDSNEFISLILMTIAHVSSHVASKSHKCILHFSIELPFSMSVTFEHPNLLNAENILYFLASHQATHLAISGKRFAISCRYLFVYCIQQQL